MRSQPWAELARRDGVGRMAGLIPIHRRQWRTGAARDDAPPSIAPAGRHDRRTPASCGQVTTLFGTVAGQRSPGTPMGSVPPTRSRRSACRRVRRPCACSPCTCWNPTRRVGAARLAAADHRGRARRGERAPRRHMVREAMADRGMVRGPQGRNADQGPQAQRRRRPAKVPGLRRHHRRHRQVDRVPRPERAGHAGADGRPPRRDPCPRRAHGEAQPPQAARPGPDGRGVRGQHRTPRRLHPLDRATHSGNQETLGRIPDPVTLRRTSRGHARIRKHRVNSVTLKGLGCPVSQRQRTPPSIPSSSN